GRAALAARAGAPTDALRMIDVVETHFGKSSVTRLIRFRAELTIGREDLAAAALDLPPGARPTPETTKAFADELAARLEPGRATPEEAQTVLLLATRSRGTPRELDATSVNGEPGLTATLPTDPDLRPADPKKITA